MAKTIVGLNDPKACNRFATTLATDSAKKSFFTTKMMGEGQDSSMPIQRMTELENDAGEMISFDLSVQLKMEPVYGDDTLENKEEELQFYTDNIYIDQMRGGVNTGGRMTRKRTLHNLRKIARKRQAEWWGRLFDEVIFVYLSGARGVNTGFLVPAGWSGCANNALQTPDADHLLYGGAATTKGTMVATDKMNLALIDKAVGNIESMGGETEEVPAMQPISICGEDHFVCVMNPWQAFDMRRNAATGEWLDVQKAAAAALGKDNPIFKGGMGMHNNVVLQKHKSIVRFTDYGTGAVEAARALILGEQAGVIAFGSPGSGFRFDWNEESRDNGNQAVITTSSIWGFKKSNFNGIDFGMMALDTAAKKPA